MIFTGVTIIITCSFLS